MTVTINGTTGVAVPLGSVSAPGVSNTTSSTTGIYNPTGTTLGIATNGTNAVYVDASQNVGIGTTSPAQKLQVVGNIMAANGTAGTPSYTFVGNSTIGMFTPDAGFSVGFATGATERMRIDSSGNLQVGGTTVTNTAGYVNSRTNARAWVNFNGNASTPITPNASYNISSVTRTATGYFTIAFATSLADANYAYSGSSVRSGTLPLPCLVVGPGASTQTASNLYIRVQEYDSTLGAVGQTSVVVFGN